MAAPVAKTEVKKDVSAVRRVRTKKMPTTPKVLSLELVRHFTPSVAGGRTIAVWHKHKLLEQTDKSALEEGGDIDTDVVSKNATVIVVEEQDGSRRTLECTEVNMEFDFLFGVFPTAYRPVGDADEKEMFIDHHIRWREVKEAEWQSAPETKRKVVHDDEKDKDAFFVMNEVPSQFDGLMQGDTVLAIMGGSGGPYVSALARRGREIGAMVLHVAPIRIKNYRMHKYGAEELTQGGDLVLTENVRNLSKKLTRLGEAGDHVATRDSLNALKEKLRDVTTKAEAHREDDALHLLELYKMRPRAFLVVEEFLAAFALAGSLYRSFVRAQDARKAEQLRLIGNAKAALYTHPEGMYPQGGAVGYVDAYLASSEALGALYVAEKSAKKGLEKALADSRLASLEAKLRGEFGFLGPRIFGAICAKVGTFARFKDEWAFNKYVGLHVNDDGTFVRRGRGLGDATLRQEIWLMVGLINRKVGSKWRGILDGHKAAIRAQHPVPEVSEKTGKSRWSPIHVKKTAEWKTATDIALAIWKLGREWEKEEMARAKAKEAVELRAA